MARGENTRMAERLGEKLGGELRDYWKENDGQHESLEKKVWRQTKRIECLERGKRREVGDGMSKGSSSESDECHGGWRWMARRGGSKWTPRDNLFEVAAQNFQGCEVDD